jgi:hypothetical protein
MTARDLDLEVTRNGRREGRFTARADPDDSATLSRMLQDWLTSRKWARSRWAEFELVVRYAGEWTQRGKVRA